MVLLVWGLWVGLLFGYGVDCRWIVVGGMYGVGVYTLRAEKNTGSSSGYGGILDILQCILNCMIVHENTVIVTDVFRSIYTVICINLGCKSSLPSSHASAVRFRNMHQQSSLRRFPGRVIQMNHAIALAQSIQSNARPCGQRIAHPFIVLDFKPVHISVV